MNKYEIKMPDKYIAYCLVKVRYLDIHEIMIAKLSKTQEDFNSNKPVWIKSAIILNLLYINGEKSEGITICSELETGQLFTVGQSVFTSQPFRVYTNMNALLSYYFQKTSVRNFLGKYPFYHKMINNGKYILYNDNADIIGSLQYKNSLLIEWEYYDVQRENWLNRVYEYRIECDKLVIQHDTYERDGEIWSTESIWTDIKTIDKNSYRHVHSIVKSLN